MASGFDEFRSARECEESPAFFGGVFISGGLISGSGLILKLPFGLHSGRLRRGHMAAQGAPADASIFPAKPKC
jgi:hypothetical protein